MLTDQMRDYRPGRLLPPFREPAGQIGQDWPNVSTRFGAPLRRVDEHARPTGVGNVPGAKPVGPPVAEQKPVTDFAGFFYPFYYGVASEGGRERRVVALALWANEGVRPTKLT